MSANGFQTIAERVVSLLAAAVDQHELFSGKNVVKLRALADAVEEKALSGMPYWAERNKEEQARRKVLLEEHAMVARRMEHQRAQRELEVCRPRRRIVCVSLMCESVLTTAL